VNKRPLIGIPTQSLHSMHGVPATLPASFAMSERYIRTVAEAGGVPLMLPLVADDEPTARAMYDALDGILFPGGADLDPDSYGAERTPLCDRSDPPRDLLELVVVRWAMEERKPLLGVCRGLQILNVAAGGTLYQDIGAEFPGAVKHDYFPGQGHARDHLAHTVRLEAATSLLAEIYGASEVAVNSLHHQGIARLGEGLVVTAVAADGLVEAVERPLADEHFAVAVQWHPEALYAVDEASRRLFAAFIAASVEFQESRAGVASGV
jgi:putative glutamine amidotransferase